ncbi:MAG TPA: hypothetical protein VHO69_03045 [Phototrophicaceae bacterium]|nr:hypothetical protein [Phototrophicaceae bacterium]
MEIQLNGSMGDPVTAQARACEALADMVPNIILDAANHTLHLRALNATGNLPLIVERLNAIGLQPGMLSVRANTLEDVFIQLTGRRLRE